MGKAVLTALVDAQAKEGWVRARERIEGKPSLRQLLEETGQSIADALDQMESEGKQGPFTLSVSLEPTK